MLRQSCSAQKDRRILSVASRSSMTLIGLRRAATRRRRGDRQVRAAGERPQDRLQDQHHGDEARAPMLAGIPSRPAAVANLAMSTVAGSKVNGAATRKTANESGAPARNHLGSTVRTVIACV